MDTTFDIEYQYQFYLKRVGLDEKKMGEDQRAEMRAAFFGAAGIMLILLRDDFLVMPPEARGKILSVMIDQVSVFFKSEILKRKNAKRN